MSYILAIDDEAALAELLHDILADEGYEVRAVTTAAEALTVAQHHPPSLILFDLTMPAMSGEQFVQAYRSLPNASAKLVAISGIPHLDREAARIGADGYVVKPYEIDDLLATIASVLE